MQAVAFDGPTNVSVSTLVGGVLYASLVKLI